MDEREKEMHLDSTHDKVWVFAAQASVQTLREDVQPGPHSSHELWIYERQGL